MGNSLHDNKAMMISYHYAVQQPQPHPHHPALIIPGYVQIDEVENGVNVRSTNLPQLWREGVPLPAVPATLPTGRYTLAEIIAACTLST